LCPFFAHQSRLLEADLLIGDVDGACEEIGHAGLCVPNELDRHLVDTRPPEEVLVKRHEPYFGSALPGYGNEGAAAHKLLRGREVRVVREVLFTAREGLFKYVARQRIKLRLTHL